VRGGCRSSVGTGPGQSTTAAIATKLYNSPTAISQKRSCPGFRRTIGRFLVLLAVAFMPRFYRAVGLDGEKSFIQSEPTPGHQKFDTAVRESLYWLLVGSRPAERPIHLPTFLTRHNHPRPPF